MQSSKLQGMETLKEPRGLAVDSLRKILYVVDGSGGNSDLWAARIYRSKNTVATEAPKKIVEGVTSNWVTVDFRGKVFFIKDNDLNSMPVSTVNTKIDGSIPIVDAVAANAETSTADDAQADTASTKEEAKKEFSVVYDGDSVSGLSKPRGLAVDGYRLFWSNGDNGEQDGTVAQGFEGGGTVTSLATNVAGAHGICLTASRVFYTDEEANVFSTKVNGGAVTTVTDKLKKPRGCVFDGDGTVFVADEGDNKVVSFAGAAVDLGPRRTSVALSDITEPFGLAVLHGNRDQLHNGVPRSAAMMTSIVLTVLANILM
jgi:hypothetical protein